MSDISLLPEDMRGKEELKKTVEPSAPTGGLRMHVPDAEPEEDIEIIEVDEGDLASVLADEPFMTRFTYTISSAIDRLRGELFGKKKEVVPPPKVPPQFFKPPKTGLISKPPPLPLATIRPLGMPPRPLSKNGAAGTVPFQAGAQKPERPRARITPQNGVPRRVRVIRRVRKPVRVSLISSKELAALTVDVSRRKWTLSVVSGVFIVTLVAAHLFLGGQIKTAQSRKANVQAEYDSLRAEAEKRLTTWSAYEDLQWRLDLLNGALERHILITRLFDFLETRTLPSVTYQSAAWTSAGNLSLDVRTDSYESAARQLVAFKESGGVQRADATTFSIGSSGEGQSSAVSFQVILSLDPQMFQNPALTPMSGAVVSSTSAVPSP